MASQGHVERFSSSHLKFHGRLFIRGQIKWKLDVCAEIKAEGGKLMRKRITNQGAGVRHFSNRQWLNVEHLAQVESNFRGRGNPNRVSIDTRCWTSWRAEEPGQQTVRLLFDEPQRVRHIRLLFQEDERQRTQEFVLRWSSRRRSVLREIVRQQYNFSPPGSTKRMRDYDVNLDRVTALELANWSPI